MPSPFARSAAILLVMTLAACSSPADRHSSESPGPRHAVVIPGAELWSGGGVLLEGLLGRVPGMQVQQRAGLCPLLRLRGSRTVLTQGNPRIYVDGTSVTDTCILQQIRSLDVKQVEIYPGGISNRAGYPASPFGLILVFLTG